VVVLVIITIGILWFVGYQDRQDKKAKLEQYTQEFLAKQKNIEAVAVKGLINEEETKTPIETIPQLLVSTSTATSNEEFHSYGLAVATALKPLSLERENEPQAVLNAIDNNDPAILRPVTESRIYHQTASRNLAQITVPKEMVTMHKKLISDLNFLVSLLINMEKAINQPQSALNNSKSFITNYSVFLKSVENLNKYLADKGVKFAPQEKIQIFVSFTQ